MATKSINEFWASRAETMLANYGDPSEPNLRFILVDLMHYAHAHQIQFNTELHSAVVHFEAELKGS